MPTAITVLLVDDHALVRRGFRRILEDEEHVAVVGEASNGVDGVEMARELKPRVVLMDWAMPGMSGLLATREIVSNSPDIAVLMLTMHSETAWVRQAIDAGARGYILKNALDLELGSTIKRVAAGELVLDPQALSKQLTPKRARACGLSRREMEVLQLIVDGKSNKEIASRLGLSVNTVAVHRANIMATLGIRKVVDLVVYAIRNRLVDIL